MTRTMLIGLDGATFTVLEPLMDDLEMILVLAVNPGWGGQGFHQKTADRLAQAREMIAGSGRDIVLCVDGGITAKNVAEVTRMGPDLIVTGSAVFDGKAPAANAAKMLAEIASARS